MDAIYFAGISGVVTLAALLMIYWFVLAIGRARGRDRAYSALDRYHDPGSMPGMSLLPLVFVLGGQFVTQFGLIWYDAMLAGELNEKRLLYLLTAVLTATYALWFLGLRERAAEKDAGYLRS